MSFLWKKIVFSPDSTHPKENIHPAIIGEDDNNRLLSSFFPDQSVNSFFKLEEIREEDILPPMDYSGSLDVWKSYINRHNEPEETFVSKSSCVELGRFVIPPFEGEEEFREIYEGVFSPPEGLSFISSCCTHYNQDMAGLGVGSSFKTLFYTAAVPRGYEGEFEDKILEEIKTGPFLSMFPYRNKLILATKKGLYIVRVNPPQEETEGRWATEFEECRIFIPYEFRRPSVLFVAPDTSRDPPTLVVVYENINLEICLARFGEIIPPVSLEVDLPAVVAGEELLSAKDKSILAPPPHIVQGLGDEWEDVKAHAILPWGNSPIISPADGFVANDFVANDFVADDFVADDFTADDFAADDFAADDFAADDFAADDFAADDANSIYEHETTEFMLGNIFKKSPLCKRSERPILDKSGFPYSRQASLWDFVEELHGLPNAPNYALDDNSRIWILSIGFLSVYSPDFELLVEVPKIKYFTIHPAEGAVHIRFALRQESD